MGNSHSEQVSGQDILSRVRCTKAKQYTNLLTSHKHLKKVLCTLQSQPFTHAISVMKLETDIKYNWEMLGKKSLSPQVSDWVLKEAEVKIPENSKFISFCKMLQKWIVPCESTAIVFNDHTAGFCPQT